MFQESNTDQSGVIVRTSKAAKEELMYRFVHNMSKKKRRQVDFNDGDILEGVAKAFGTQGT